MATREDFDRYFDAQKLRVPSMADSPVFYKNLEQVLDKRRSEKSLMSLRMNRDWVDFSSNDTLSLSTSGAMRRAFLEEIELYPDFQLGSGGARMLDGNNTYIENLEKELAEFHGAETGLMFHTGYEANGAIFGTIPQLGDAVVYDDLIHASVWDGLAKSSVKVKESFRHNDVDSFREVLEYVKNSNDAILDGERCVLVSIESVYSMDGDIAPLAEFVAIAKELFPLGNIHFIIDEAHSNGIFGNQGAGLVSSMGLEQEFAIRLHTFGKALGSTGAVVLANETVKNMIINHARCFTFSTAPSFVTLAAVRAGYNLLKADVGNERQGKIQHLVRFFFKTIFAHPVWQMAKKQGVLSLPVGEAYWNKPLVSHIVPVYTRDGENVLLSMHLLMADICAWPIDYPVVPKGKGRVRVMFHTSNTEDDVLFLVDEICNWAQETMDSDLTLQQRYDAKVKAAKMLAGL